MKTYTIIYVTKIVHDAVVQANNETEVREFFREFHPKEEILEVHEMKEMAVE